MDITNMKLIPGKLYVFKTKHAIDFCCESKNVDFVRRHASEPMLLLKDFNGPSNDWKLNHGIFSLDGLETTMFFIHNKEIEFRSFRGYHIFNQKKTSRELFLDSFTKIS